jgi:hypothetical protein
MTDIFSALEARLASMEATPSAIPSLTPVLAPTDMNGIPAVSDITVIKFNLFDNGENLKVKWTSSRFAVSMQVFTRTTPFTPSSSLAAWTGTVQLHDPGFWHNYIEFKHKEGKIDQATYDRLIAMNRDTYRDPNKTDPRIGTFMDKRHGTNYSWPYAICFWFDPFGEPNLELSLDEVMPTIDIWETVKQVPGKTLPILRARHNPLNLWKPKYAKGKQA